MPELRIGFGIGSELLQVEDYSDSVPLQVEDFNREVDLEIERFQSFSLRGQLEFDNGVYLYIAPYYSEAKIKATATVTGYGISASGSGSEIFDESGISAGAGYDFSETASAELSYEQFDGTTDILTLGVKFNF